MKLYKVETQEDYEALMMKFEKREYEQVEHFREAYHIYEDDTHIVIDDSLEIPMQLIYGAYAENWYKDIPIQKYKAPKITS